MYDQFYKLEHDRRVRLREAAVVWTHSSLPDLQFLV